MRRTTQKIGFCIAALLVLVAAAPATESTTMTFSKPTNTTDTTVKVVINPGVDVEVDIPAGTSAAAKRDLIKDALDAAGYDTTTTGLAGNQVKIEYLANGTKVVFQPGKTGEKKDDVVGDATSEASISMGNAYGYYDPYDSEGEVAVFTAGFITEYGEFAVEISAEDLQFETTPEHICWQLFAQLQPVAWDYGVEIVCLGDSMEFYFDAALTGQQVGVSFGTTSPTEGFEGGVVLAGEPSCPGDINGDGIVDLSDLAELLAAYGTAEGEPGYIPSADLDGDGWIGLPDLAALLSVYGMICE